MNIVIDNEKIIVIKINSKLSSTFIIEVYMVNFSYREEEIEEL